MNSPDAHRASLPIAHKQLTILFPDEQLHKTLKSAMLVFKTHIGWLIALDAFWTSQAVPAFKLTNATTKQPGSSTFVTCLRKLLNSTAILCLLRLWKMKMKLLKKSSLMQQNSRILIRVNASRYHKATQESRPLEIINLTTTSTPHHHKKMTMISSCTTTSTTEKEGLPAIPRSGVRNQVSLI